MTLREKVWKKVKEVPDPELGISLVDLGLIYKVKVQKNGQVKILMTLTTVGCPLFDLISSNLCEKVKEIAEVKNVEVELTFDPPWDPSRLTGKAREKLGFF